VVTDVLYSHGIAYIGEEYSPESAREQIEDCGHTEHEQFRYMFDGALYCDSCLNDYLRALHEQEITIL